MHYRRSSNVNLRKLLPIGILCSIGIAAILSHPASAATTSATITMGDIVGQNVMVPKGHKSSAVFYVPVTINVKNSEYYTVSFNMVGSSDLRDSASGNVIPTVSTGTSYTDLNDAWGMYYSFGDDIDTDVNRTFNPAPVTAYNILPDSTELVTSRPYGAEETKVLTIGYAASVREDFPAGNYKSTLNISVVAAPLDTATTLHDIEYMQDMNPLICGNTTTPLDTVTEHDDTGTLKGNKNYIPRTMLRDKRDDHMYVVEKLADGNCWMTENLALTAGMVLTRADSNVTADYTVPNNSNTFSGTSGKMRLGDANVDANYKFAFLRGSDPSSHYNTATGHTGSWYNWWGAVAGNRGGANTDGANATEDICPKNWQIPTKSDGATLSTTYNNDLFGILHLAKTGIFYGNGALDGVGTDSGLWTRTAVNTASHYSIMSSGVTSTYNENNGYPVRCLAKRVES